MPGHQQPASCHRGSPLTPEEPDLPAESRKKGKQGSNGTRLRGDSAQRPTPRLGPRMASRLDWKSSQGPSGQGDLWGYLGRMRGGRTASDQGL